MSPADAQKLGAAWIRHGGGWRLGAVDVSGRIYTGSPDEMAAPDPREPATLGTWLATIRARKLRPTLCIVSADWGGWNVHVDGGLLQERGVLAWFPTEADALLALLGVPPGEISR